MADSRFSGGKVTGVRTEGSHTFITTEHPETGVRTTHIVSAPQPHCSNHDVTQICPDCTS
jgi:hypothetical protein